MKPPFEMIQETEIEKWRYETFWTKEPETIEWIKSFNPSENFFDVGANIGIYSLFCAELHPQTKVIAVEPFKKNFGRLCENIKLNDYHNISPINLAIGNEDDILHLKSVNDEVGSSGHQLSGDGDLCLTVKLDTLSLIAKMFFFPINHIKIDTDGNEYDIIHGAKETLASKDLQSVLIEVNNHKEEIIEIFKQNGFTTDNRFNTMTPHSRERRAKEGIDAENIIFTRC